MNSLITLLASRYIKGSRETQSISTMVLVSFLGTIIGSAALAMTLFVMNGFEHATYDKLERVHAPIIMQGFNQEPLDDKKIEQVLRAEFPCIAGISPVSVQYALLQQPAIDTLAPILLRGIDPEKEHAIISIEHYLLPPEEPEQHAQPLADLLNNSGVLIGKQLAEHAQVTIGDSLELLIPEETARRNRLQFSPHSATIAGIFKTGIDELDGQVILCNRSFLQKLFPHAGTSSINLRPHTKQLDLNNLIQQLQIRFGLHVFSWHELYPAVISALTLEKYTMFFVLALITLVASMSIISLLFMIIIQKRTDIALLKSLGMTTRSIRAIFLIIGTSICSMGSIVGLSFACIGGYLLESYRLITLPDVYYVDHLPAYIDVGSIALVFTLVVILGFIASWIPTRGIAHINIAQQLRYEG